MAFDPSLFPTRDAIERLHERQTQADNSLNAGPIDVAVFCAPQPLPRPATFVQYQRRLFLQRHPDADPRADANSQGGSGHGNDDAPCRGG